MKLYAITKGKYEDYHICALTSDKDKAARLKSLYSDQWYNAYIEEYEDGNENKNGQIPFRYWTQFEDEEEDCYALEGNSVIPEEDYISYDENGNIVTLVVFASDIEGAKEKAREIVAKYEAGRVN